MPVTIEDLPAEVLGHILWYIDSPGRRLYQQQMQFRWTTPPRQRKPAPISDLLECVTVCRQWQHVVERITFRYVCLKSNELPYFEGVLNARRRAAMSHLMYEILLPGYDDQACTHVETEEEKFKNDEFFTNAIYGLFDILKAGEEDDAQNSTGPFQHPLLLHIVEIYSPSDTAHCAVDKLEILRQNPSRISLQDLFECRYRNSLLKLLPTKRSLPVLSRVDDFRVEFRMPRAVTPMSFAEILAKLPNFKNLEWKLGPYAGEWPAELRLLHDAEFITVLREISLSSLESIVLNYNSETPKNQLPERLPTRISESQPDTFSLELNSLFTAPRMTSLCLAGSIQISPCLFYPLPPAAVHSKLQYLNVSFNILAPDGEWYFGRDHEDEVEAAGGEELMNQPFRFFPSTAKIMPLLKAFAQAAQVLRDIKEMTLGKHFSSGPPRMFQVKYLASGKSSGWDGRRGLDDVERQEVHVDAANNRRLYIVASGWRGEDDREGMDEVIRLFREASDKDDLVVKFFKGKW